MRGLILALVGLCMCGLAIGQPLQLGFQANLGLNESERFAETFDYIRSSSGYDIEGVSFDNNTAFIQASKNGELDLVYTGPVMFICLQLASPGTKGMNEIIQLNKIDNTTAVEMLAGAIVVRESMNITTTADLRGAIVVTGNTLNLASFQSQWYAVETPAFSLFRDAKAIFVSSTPLTIMDAIVHGVGDVGFVEAGMLEAAVLQNNGSIGLKVVLQQNHSGYPYMHSTGLYASSLVSGQLKSGFHMRARVAEALLSIPEGSEIPLEDNYFSFSTNGDYGVIRTVLNAQQFIDPQSNLCKIGGDLGSLVSCPVGYHEIDDPSQACQTGNIACPPGYMCVCSPCAKDIIPSMVAGLSPFHFGIILAAIVLCGAVILFIGIRLVIISKPIINWKDLQLDSSYPLGKSSNGLVIRGKYVGQDVAVKRAFDRPFGKRVIFDDDDTPVATGIWVRRWHGISYAMGQLAECFWIHTRDQRRLKQAFGRMGQNQSNIMPLLAIARGPIGGILVVMPLMRSGTIADLLSSRQHGMDERMVMSIASDVCNAMVFFHQQHPPMIGKNMKPHHLFLDSSWRTIVGLSFRPQNKNSIWAAPEVLRGGQWTKEADVYAYGLLLWTLVHREMPFQGRRSTDLIEMVKDGQDALDSARPPLTGDSPMHVLISNCWDENPLARPSFSVVQKALQAMDGQTYGPRPSFSVGPQKQLLEGMFPDRVRALLEQGKPVPPVDHDDVTCFFSDIKGYTDFSRDSKPEAMQEMLHNLFSYMDACAEREGVHKIETIGDSMFAVTNLMTPQPDHVARMGRFALAVLEGSSKMPLNARIPNSKMIEMRCGIHTGRVSSGVLGTTNLRFCVIGHTVNIASRMESTGVPNRIQMTEATAKVMKRDGVLGPRVKRRAAMVDVKGQGKMRTYWLLRDCDIDNLSRRSSLGSFTSRNSGEELRFKSGRDSSRGLQDFEVPDVVVE